MSLVRVLRKTKITSLTPLMGVTSLPPRLPCRPPQPMGLPLLPPRISSFLRPSPPPGRSDTYIALSQVRVLGLKQMGSSPVTRPLSSTVPRMGWSPVPLRGAPPLRPQAVTQMGVRLSAKRSYSSHSSQEENWHEILKPKLEGLKNTVKDHRPLVCSTLSAAKKQVQTRIKAFLLALFDLLLDFARMATDHVIEGFKSKVNESFYLIFILAVAWCAYQVGEKFGIFDTTSSDSDFDEIMENVPKDGNGNPVKVALAVMGLKLLHQILIEAKSIGLEMREIKNEAQVIRTRTEQYELAAAALQDEVSKLKEGMQKKSGAGEVQKELKKSGAEEGQQEPRKQPQEED